MSNYNKKVVINSDNNYSTMMFNITPNKDDNIYDIVIDPGHGGVDSGAVNSKYTEAHIAMDISKKIYNNLKKTGLKVKLTRTENSLDDDEYFEEYKKGGRAVISHEVKANYILSIHANSSDSPKVNGIEIYTAKNINYNLAQTLIKNITSKVPIKVSTKNIYKVKEGIYTHNLTDAEITKALNNYDQKGYKRYKITTNSNYLYMIRETGGIMTGAYVDDRNLNKVGENPYYNSNIGAEAYLLELGYLTNKSDLKVLTKNSEEYAKAISDGIKNYLQ